MKRRKEGVFYTPEFITDFICRNTIIPYLSKKGAKNINDLVSEYQEELGTLESKLRSIRILDPACGCGAFLIKAFDVLLDIAKRIRSVKDFRGKYKRLINKKNNVTHEGKIEEEARLIVENNVYGVDINETSVAFTKIRLYSKIASDDRVSVDLSRNIKFGDSLIDDASLIGNKAFDWSHEFEEISNKGGFDIIIGNPPYINIIKDIKSKKYFKARFPEIYTGKNDIYYYFFQKAIELSKRNGYITFIAPRYLMEAFEARKLREYILKETAIQKIIDFSDFKIFGDANIDTAIYFLRKTSNRNLVKVHKLVKKPLTHPLRLETTYFQNYYMKQNQLTGNKWYFIDPKIQALLDKIDAKATGKLKDYSVLSKGIQTGKDSVFVITKAEVEKYSIEKKILNRWLKNSQIRRFGPIDTHLFVITSNKKTIKELSRYPNLAKYLEKNKGELLNRARVVNWFHWRKGDERFTIDWKKPKVITPYKSAYNNFTIDDRGCYFSQDIVLIIPVEEIDIRYLLSFLNSKLCEFYFKIKGKRLGTVYDYYPRQIEELPFLKIEKEEQKVFVKIVDRLLKLNRSLTQKLLTTQTMISDPDIKNEIIQVENELNHLTNQLYGLNAEEIRLLHSSP